MVLTKAGSVLGPVATVLGYIMDILFQFTGQFGILNVGLCIILFTIVMKTLMIPLTVKQQKSTKLMSIMSPELQAIQKKYKGKTDNESMQRQNVEMQAVYEKYGTSMTGGCLPLIIQMVILLALYRVIYNIPAYVPSVRVYFDNVVTPLMSQADYIDKLQGITDIMKAAAVNSLDKFDFTSANKLVDLLYKFTPAQWTELQNLFPGIASVIAENEATIRQMNTFLGLNMAEAPGWVPSFAWLIPILAAVTQWFSTKLMSGQQPKMDSDNVAAQSMQTMTTVMPLFSAFICVTMPASLGLYWIATSVVQIIQQLLVNSYMDKVDIDEMVKKNIEKVNAKRAKQGLPPAKISQNATASLKSVKEEQEREKEEEEKKRERIAKQIQESSSYYNANARPGSLAAKANMVQKYNEAHEKRGKNK
ncbi:MAG: YidC/Oxa1 family membrane protein insertase [Lachnospiraceae bacterium]|jgi:YidC/Oxa1 family membrane protein insertase|nr:YidC/Oxa1 family membrane protein insertase [Lachnospiraceae bacterium]NBJ83675.1 membrane protein insertase YidC [bacterium 1XD42-76]NBK06988.1 membrane protein insertase YidC [bacterium 1XD42-94]